MAAKAHAGLRVGDGLRIGARTSRRVLPPARRISALEARRLAPALAEDGLRGALLSWDGQLEDDARLVVAVARTAASFGARVITRAGVTAVRDDGVDAVDALTGAPFSVSRPPRRGRDGRVGGRAGRRRGAAAEPRLAPARARRAGSATRARRSTCPCRASAAAGCSRCRAPTGWSRSGSPTSPPTARSPTSRCRAPEEEAELLAHASAALEVCLAPEDVVGRYAGLRPLLAAEGATADLSRRHAVVEDGAGAHRGGRQAHDLPARWRRTSSTGSPSGRAARSGCRSWARRGAPAGAPPRLARRYGAEAAAVAALAEGRPELLEPVAPGRAGVRRRAAVGASATSSRSASTTSPTGAPARASCPSGVPRWSRPPSGWSWLRRDGVLAGRRSQWRRREACRPSPVRRGVTWTSLVERRQTPADAKLAATAVAGSRRRRRLPETSGEWLSHEDRRCFRSISPSRRDRRARRSERRIGRRGGRATPSPAPAHPVTAPTQPPPAKARAACSSRPSACRPPSIRGSSRRSRSSTPATAGGRRRSATSCGAVSTRPSACSSPSSASRSGDSRPVSIVPGATAFTRIPCGPYSTASARVRPSIAALAVA